VDLNFKNPEVLYAFIRLIKFLVSKKVKLFRLDAIAFLWKESGTPCVHLNQTHEAVKLIRLILEQLDPESVLITETNVPNRENLSYFGNDNEAHLIYNFSLPPLLIYSLLKGDSSHLKTWMMSMPPARKGRSYLNFIASHDGVGVRPLEGLVSANDQKDLLNTLEGFGATISNRKVNGRDEVPYEVNISLYDAMKGTINNGEDEWQNQRYICAHTILLALEGIPAFYIHSLLATKNAHDLQKETGQARSINRYCWEQKALNQKLSAEKDHHKIIFDEFKRRMDIRKKQTAFHPNATQLTLHLGDQLFAFWRESLDRHQSLFALHNVSDKPAKVSLNELNLISTDNWRDLLTDQKFTNVKEDIELPPYGCIWISNA
jgi:sucrose phosphorylase